MDRYVCSVCGYVYDPAQGDPENGIKPGTKFEDLPDDWTCPVCGAHLISISYTAPKIPNAVPQKPIAAHQQGPPWQLPLHLPLPAAA